MRTPVQRCSLLLVWFPAKGPLVSTVAPVQTTKHRCAGNRRTSQRKNFKKSASKQSAAGISSHECSPVCAARSDMSLLKISNTKQIRSYMNVSTRRAGSVRDPVPVDPPPQNTLSQSRQKKIRTSKTSSRRPAWKGSEKD